MDATGTEILLVEDSTDFARMYRLRLEMDGHRVRIAGTGAEAIAMASASWPDLILLDVDLPDMDGFQVFAELRARHTRPRVVFLTITDSDELIGLALSMGALAYLRKPKVTPDYLAARIRSWTSVPAGDAT